MANSTNTERTAERSNSSAWCVGTLVLGLSFGVCIAIPAVVTVANIAASVARNGPGGLGTTSSALTSLGRSAFFAGAIATLALLLAWPVALLVGRARARWMWVVVTPMLLPTYLAYAGWSIARSPTTPIGRFIGEAPDRGMEWMPVFSGRALAVWGLALWAWPLAAVILAPGLGRVVRTIGEPLALEGAGVIRRTRSVAWAARSSVAAAWGIVFLFMLGSAVPLHVAQIETYAIRVWAALDANFGDPARAWITAWPLATIALISGLLLSGPLTRSARAFASAEETTGSGKRAPAGRLLAGAAPLLLSLVVPFTLFVWSMGSWRTFSRFLADARDALFGAFTVGAGVGVVGVIVCAATANACARGPSTPRTVRWVLAGSLAWALLPGVLPGSAVAQAVGLTGAPWLADSALPVVVAHMSRFMFIPVLLGVWLGATEAVAIRELRVMDDALGLRRWMSTALPAQIGPLLGAGIACACLSFHEIEASVRVQPPGLDHLAQRLLQWLHYERMGELSAAGVLLLGIGIVAAGAIALATWLGGVRTGARRGR